MPYWITPVLIIGARLLWQRNPGLATASLFWATSMILIVIIGWTAAPSQYLLTTGILCNAAVTLANGGFMPVAMHRRLASPARSLWVERTSSHRLLFLADNFGTPFMRFSIGDVLLASGLVLAVLGY